VQHTTLDSYPAPDVRRWLAGDGARSRHAAHRPPAIPPSATPPLGQTGSMMPSRSPATVAPEWCALRPHSPSGERSAGPSCWQAQRFPRGWGTWTGPKTVFTGVCPASWLVYRGPPWGPARLGSSSGYTCCCTMNSCTPASSALRTNRFAVSESTVQPTRLHRERVNRIQRRYETSSERRFSNRSGQIENANLDTRILKSRTANRGSGRGGARLSM